MERITALIELGSCAASNNNARISAGVGIFVRCVGRIGYEQLEAYSSGRLGGFNPADFWRLHITTFPADTLGHHQGEVIVKVGGRSVAAHPRHIDAL